MSILKSIGAVVAGFVVVFVLAVATDIVLVMAHVFPPVEHPEQYGEGMYAAIVFYTALYSVAGAWLTAKLAPSSPMTHALVLGVLGTLSSALGAWANWGKAAGHEWYPIALIVIALPTCWLGGKLYVKSAGKKAAQAA
jgi:hypothetical protein